MLELAQYGFAVFYLVWVLQNKDAPFNVFQFLRNVIRRVPIIGTNVLCSVCFSLTLGALVAFAHYFGARDLVRVFTAPFAIAGVSVLLHTLSGFPPSRD